MFDRKDRYVGLGFVAFGAIMFYVSTTWTTNFTSDPAGPAAIPKLLCAALVLLGAILTAGGFSVKAVSEQKIATKAEILLLAALTAICVLYIVLLPIIGYLLATPLLIAGVMVAVGSRKVSTIALVSVIATIVLFVLFKYLLQVNLPLGFMKGLFAGIF